MASIGISLWSCVVTSCTFAALGRHVLSVLHQFSFNIENFPNPFYSIGFEDSFMKKCLKGHVGANSSKGHSDANICYLILSKWSFSLNYLCILIVSVINAILNLDLLLLLFFLFIILFIILMILIFFHLNLICVFALTWFKEIYMNFIWHGWNVNLHFYGWKEI